MTSTDISAGLLLGVALLILVKADAPGLAQVHQAIRNLDRPNPQLNEAAKILVTACVVMLAMGAFSISVIQVLDTDTNAPAKDVPDGLREDLEYIVREGVDVCASAQDMNVDQNALIDENLLELHISASGDPVWVEPGQRLRFPPKNKRGRRKYVDCPDYEWQPSTAVLPWADLVALILKELSR